MSSPITINASASSASRMTSTLSISASPFEPKYIPVHRRTPSNGSVASSSRPSSPMEVDFAHSEVAIPTPGAYSIDALLALRPLANDNMKNVLRDTCPEVLMNHRQKKSVQYLSNHPEARPKTQNSKPQQKRSDSRAPIPPMPLAFTGKRPQRSHTRRTRSGRGPERRRNILQETWQGMRVTARQPLMVV